MGCGESSLRKGSDKDTYDYNCLESTWIQPDAGNNRPIDALEHLYKLSLAEKMYGKMEAKRVILDDSLQAQEDKGEDFLLSVQSNAIRALELKAREI